MNLYLETQLPKDLFLDALVKTNHTFLTAVIQGHISICTSNLYRQEDEGLHYHHQVFFWKQLFKTSQNNLLAVVLQPSAPLALAKTKNIKSHYPHAFQSLCKNYKHWLQGSGENAVPGKNSTTITTVKYAADVCKWDSRNKIHRLPKIQKGLIDSTYIYFQSYVQITSTNN